jgi:DNA-directed RNA polymerase subunit F
MNGREILKSDEGETAVRERELKSKLLHAMSRLSDSVQAASPADAASLADVLHLISEFISETALRRLTRLEPQTSDELADILARLEQPRTLGRSDLGRIRHRLVELMSKPA